MAKKNLSTISGIVESTHHAKLKATRAVGDDDCNFMSGMLYEASKEIDRHFAKMMEIAVTNNFDIEAFDETNKLVFRRKNGRFHIPKPVEEPKEIPLPKPPAPSIADLEKGMDDLELEIAKVNNEDDLSELEKFVKLLNAEEVAAKLREIGLALTKTKVEDLRKAYASVFEVSEDSVKNRKSPTLIKEFKELQGLLVNVREQLVLNSEEAPIQEV